MRRVIPLILLASVMLAGCLPQFVGSNPLSLAVTSETETTITLRESEAVFDVHLDIGGAELVRPVGDLLTCEPFEGAFSCELTASAVAGSQPHILRPPVSLTVLAYSANPKKVTAQVWYSVPGRRDRIARATVP